jgi:hypothetical protein
MVSLLGRRTDNSIWIMMLLRYQHGSENSHCRLQTLAVRS